MKKLLIPDKLKPGDTIGIIAPSRPIYTRQNEFNRGIKILKDSGYKIKLGKNLNKHLYYSAGTAEERSSDFNEMITDLAIKAIFFATGGITSNQILSLIDYESVKNNPKIIIGYSDNTNLLLALHNKTGLVTFHGPDICALGYQSNKTLDELFRFLTKGISDLPAGMEIIKPGQAEGKLIGGNIFLSNGLVGTGYLPDYTGGIWFWEDADISPAELDFALQRAKLAGITDQISAMVVGHLDKIIDKKYPNDNRPVDEIILNLTKDYTFPVIALDYFGHEINNFRCFPVGIKAKIDTKSKSFLINTW